LLRASISSPHYCCKNHTKLRSSVYWSEIYRGYSVATWRKLRYSRRVDVKAGCCRGGATPGTPTQVRSVVASEVQDAEGREYCRGGTALPGRAIRLRAIGAVTCRRHAGRSG